MEKRNCLRCNGTGKVKDYSNDGEKDCPFCKGTKEFVEVDSAGILSQILVNRKGQKTLRSSKPTKGDNRTYFVWRIARFHGGKDVTMPVWAGMLCEYDPFRKELEKLSESVAREFLGTDMAAACRWGKAMGW